MGDSNFGQAFGRLMQTMSAPPIQHTGMVGGGGMHPPGQLAYMSPQQFMGGLTVGPAATIHDINPQLTENLLERGRQLSTNQNLVGALSKDFRVSWEDVEGLRQRGFHKAADEYQDLLNSLKDLSSGIYKKPRPQLSDVTTRISDLLNRQDELTAKYSKILRKPDIRQVK